MDTESKVYLLLTAVVMRRARELRFQYATPEQKDAATPPPIEPYIADAIEELREWRDDVMSLLRRA